ncbi:MAG: FAD:protein FMN transferase [Lachnospiraceae bacterium]|nr:FAD:protein FMN transferase [Lachnospiraceae bacterium]
MKKQIRRLTVLSIICSILCSCSAKSPVPQSAEGLYFDTVISIELYGCSPDEAGVILSECLDMCRHYEDLFDKNKITSDIAIINSSSGRPVHVDHETALLIERSLDYCRLTEGRFDITIEPVTSLWDFHGDQNKVPDDTDLEKACELVDYKNITVNTEDDTVTVSGGSSVDIGGVAKGYIADRIADKLISLDIPGAIINMGGDMRLVGNKDDGSSFTIGINDPFESGAVSAALLLDDISVATSGTYERCFTIDGKKYHHIMDTSTGYPVDTDIESVTVITKSSFDADCLCTAALIYGSRDAMALIEDTPNTEAVFILRDKTLLMSSGALRYIRQ